MPGLRILCEIAFVYNDYFTKLRFYSLQLKFVFAMECVRDSRYFLGGLIFFVLVYCIYDGYQTDLFDIAASQDLVKWNDEPILFSFLQIRKE